MKQQQQIWIFGLVICLIFVSGWTGKKIPLQSFDAGNFFYQLAGQADETGVKSLPGLDRAVFLNGNDFVYGRSIGDDQGLVAQVTAALFVPFELTQIQEGTALIRPANDQINLISVAPRA